MQISKLPTVSYLQQNSNKYRWYTFYSIPYSILQFSITIQCTLFYICFKSICTYPKEDIRQKERTLSVNYPVLRQNKRELLNTFGKHHNRKIQHCTSIQEARRDRWIECTERILMTVVFSYSIIHAYFVLVQGSSH